MNVLPHGFKCYAANPYLDYTLGHKVKKVEDKRLLDSEDIVASFETKQGERNVYSANSIIPYDKFGRGKLYRDEQLKVYQKLSFTHYLVCVSGEVEVLSQSRVRELTPLNKNERKVTIDDHLTVYTLNDLYREGWFGYVGFYG